MPRTHYNTTSANWPDERNHAAPKGRRRVIPHEVIRRKAQESHEGGRGQCAICHDNFSMTYLNMCKVTCFRTDHVCKDCQKALGLTRV